MDKYFVLEDYKEMNPDLLFNNDQQYIDHWNNIGKKEMRIFHKNLIDLECEFSHEMTFFIPYYSYLLKNNLFHQNLEIVTFKGMEPFYCFLINKIKIKFVKTHERKTNGISLFILDEIIKFEHSDKYSIYDFKSFYKNDLFKYEKDIILIINKYAQNNTEINLYFSKEVLISLFETFSDKYQIIYHQSPPFYKIEGYSYDGGEYSVNKKEDSYFFQEENLQKLKDKYNIILFSDILNSHKFSYNELQLKLFSSCNNYICHPGGLAEIIALYFAKKIIYWNQPYTYSSVINGMYITDSNNYNWDSQINDLHDSHKMKNLCNSIF